MEDFVSTSVSEVNVEVDVQALCSLLHDLGVDDQADVNHVCEADLTKLLNPVHARKLLAYWNSRFVLCVMLYY